MILSSKNSFYAASLICFSLGSTAAFSACALPSYNENRPVPPGFDMTNAFQGRFDYPATTSEALPGFMSIDFTREWRKYAEAVLAYSFEGNLAVDFDVRKNNTRDWYHTVWMHPGDSGREIMHGLTKERGTDPEQLAKGLRTSFETWAIGFYNSHGATTFAKIWQQPCNPAIDDVYFPAGTTTFKLLFSSATPAELPYLQGAPVWRANTGIDPPKVRDLSLYQIDIAVRDPRSLQTGWVFGTFVYQATEPGDDPWKKMVPVGLSWGNDRFVVRGTNSQPLKQNIVNEDLRDKIFGWTARRELGWGGRLNGPADNLTSSCISCHGSAQYPRSDDFGNVPRYPSSSKNDDDRRLMEYFRDVFAGSVFDAETRYFNSRLTVLARPLDYSLQLQTAIERMCSEALRGNGPFENSANPVPVLCDGKGTQTMPTIALEAIVPEASLNTDAMLEPIR